MSSETPTPAFEPTRTAPSFTTLTESLTALGGRVTDAILYSSIYLAVITMVEVGLVTVALSLPWSPAPLVGGLVTFAIYTHDRLSDADADELSNPKQAAFARRHRNVLYVAASASYGLATAIAVLGGPLTLLLTISPGVFGLLYSKNWLSSLGAPVSRLKDVFLVNSTVVALAWAGSLTLLPLAFTGAAVGPAALVVFAYFLLGTFVNTEIPNVRDVESDTAVGVKTLPVVAGVLRTRRVLYALDLVTIGVLFVAVQDALLPLGLVLALVVGLAYSVVVTGFLGRTANYGRLTVAAESEYVVVVVALAVLGAVH